MLPDKYDRDDERWIERQLRNIPQHLRKKACEGYAEVYLAAYNAEPSELRKPGAARFAANTRLREYVEKLNSARTTLTGDDESTRFIVMPMRV